MSNILRSGSSGTSKRAIVLVLDSLGIGASDDAVKFNNEGANTLLHIAEQCAAGKCEQGRTGRLSIPNLQQMGIADACLLSCGEYPPLLNEYTVNIGAWGFAQELSSAKDTTSGHWEMMGVPVLYDWGYFTNKKLSFSNDFVCEFSKIANLPGILGNCHASGIDIIQEYGEEHIRSGKPICYTSADSVFQIAYHESIWSKERAEEVCLAARKLLDKKRIARVISRPFVGGKSGGFERTGNRRDYSMEAPSYTLLDWLVERGYKVTAVGKIADIFAHRGISEVLHASGLQELMDKTIQAWQEPQHEQLIFTNLVDFDTLYGHRRDVNGYASALEYFDKRLGELLKNLRNDDLLIITADHGCDPTFAGTDHTREHVPILTVGAGIKGSLGKRNTFADIGQTLASFFGVNKLGYGESFLP